MFILFTKHTGDKKTAFWCFSSKHFKLRFVAYFSLFLLLFLLVKQSQMNDEKQANIFFQFSNQAKLTYMPNDISSWFIQLESKMAMHGLNSQIKKFHFCIGNLPGHIIAKIRDLVENPPASNIERSNTRLDGIF